MRSRYRRASRRRGALDVDATLSDQLRWLADAGFSDVDCIYKHYFIGIFYGRKRPAGDGLSSPATGGFENPPLRLDWAWARGRLLDHAGPSTCRRTLHPIVEVRSRHLIVQLPAVSIYLPQELLAVLPSGQL